jgi:hypothetical protein
MSTPLDTNGGKVGPFEGPDSAGGQKEHTAAWSFDAQRSDSSVSACFGEQDTVSATPALIAFPASASF